MMRLGAIGDNCIDLFGPPVSLSTVGGNAVNAAVHLARAGHDTGYFGAVGDDEPGRRVREALAENRVGVAGLVTLGEPTAFTRLEIGEGGDRRIAFEDFGACAAYRPDPAILPSLRSMRILHIGWLPDASAVKHRLAGSECLISQDLAVTPDAGGVAIAFASAGESIERAETLLDEMAAKGIPVAVVTCGSRGSMASVEGRRIRLGIAPARVVDTTGAGDTFIAGFLAAYAEGRAIEACLAAARDAAALTCEHVGGFPQLPRPLMSSDNSRKS
jgi:fructoselysine 6-kinase